MIFKIKVVAIFYFALIQAFSINAIGTVKIERSSKTGLLKKASVPVPYDPRYVIDNGIYNPTAVYYPPVNYPNYQVKDPRYNNLNGHYPNYVDNQNINRQGTDNQNWTSGSGDQGSNQEHDYNDEKQSPTQPEGYPNNKNYYGRPQGYYFRNINTYLNNGQNYYKNPKLRPNQYQGSDFNDNNRRDYAGSNPDIQYDRPFNNNPNGYIRYKDPLRKKSDIDKQIALGKTYSSVPIKSQHLAQDNSSTKGTPTLTTSFVPKSSTRAPDSD